MVTIGPRRRPDRRDVLATGGAATLLAGLPGTAPAAATTAPPATRRRPFDLGWRFLRGGAAGAEAAAFDDSGWRLVDLPHDWSIEDLPAPPDGAAGIVGPFDRHAEGGTATGFTIGGSGWYRKRFRLDVPDGGRAEIVFDGVYLDAEVWLNGHRLGANASGYVPFAFDLTPYLARDGHNVLAVHVRNEGQNSRWYSGSGIYRHVWLEVFAEASRVARWGVAVTTRRIAGARAELSIATACDDLAPGLTLVSRIADPRGRIVWEGTAAARAASDQTASLRAPRLWSPETPALYTLTTELRRGGTVLDRVETRFGVRIVAFDAVRGMTVNGTPTKLRGGCVHHDNGLLGACAFDAAEDRKVALLRARGYNAVRPSHNLFSPAFLDACDRHGMMVVEETFDVWRWGKKPQDYATVFDDRWRADLATIIRSTRNHPSIVMWSVGNEIPQRNSPDGVRLAWDIVNEAHRVDPSRPVTAAVNGFPGRLVTPDDGTARAGAAGRTDYKSNLFLDVVGYNYKLADYEADHRRFPQRVFVGTESFPKDVFAIWDLTDRSPWLVGDFVWTAMDYLGEAGIGGSAIVPAKAKGFGGLSSWPWVNAYCGDIDLIGHQKAPSLARDVVWGVSALEMAVQRPVPDGKAEALRIWGWSDELPSWTWPGAEGRPLAVRVYTAGDRIELRLDGRTVADRAVTAADMKHVELRVDYVPGVLEAIAYRGGGEIARRRLTTAGAPAAVRLVAERPDGGAERGDISYVRAEIVDGAGRIVPDAAARLTFSLSGPAELAAVGTASPFATGSFRKPAIDSWRGRALAILRGTGAPGTVRIEAKAEGLRTGVAMIRLA